MIGVGTSQVIVDYDVAVQMPDGVTLRADVFRPAISGRYPVILARTPYGKLWTPPDLARVVDPLNAARNGYVVAIQDVRGTGSSEGHFKPYADMEDDGVASIEWAASQEWSNGEVGMAGFSHLAAAQLVAATRTPPALKAIAPSLAASEFYDGCRYQGGALQIHNALPWAAAMAYVSLLHDEQQGHEVGDGRAELQMIVADFPSAIERTPQSELAASTPWLADYADWIAHPDRDDFWRATAVTERYQSIAVPALHTIGWYDNFLKGTLENYCGLREHAGTSHARENQRLIIGPWGHGTPGDALGELWFGPSATGGAGLDQAHIEFFDTFLKGEPPGDRAPVQIFVMGMNHWRDEDVWPLARAVERRLHLRDGGRLSFDRPSDEPHDTFRYDPSDPVPTLGLSSQRGDYGPRDRRSLHQRADVLLYSSEPLTESLEVTGPLRMNLHVATSAKDTDFTATLLDVYPDGRAMGIAEGILRLRYRQGLDRQILARPDEIYEITIDLVATSNVFLPGHRLAIEISSSNFPRFDRNPNTGGVVAEASEADFLVATQYIFHDSARPSALVLPVVE